MRLLSRRHLTLGLLGAAVAPGLVRAQNLPATAKVLAPFPPGGATDMIARSLAEQLRGVIASTVLVENRPGAGGRIAVNDIKQAGADGLTLMVNVSGLVTVYPHTVKQMNYDPFTDVAPVSLTNRIEMAWAVGPMVPTSVKSLKDYIAWVKANPNNDSFASTAPASPTEFLGLMLGRATGVPLRSVNYRGSSPAIIDAVGGQVAAISSPLPDLIPHIKAGKLRLLATSGANRSKNFPDVPTYAELGFPQMTTEDWYAVFVRGNTPPAVQQRLSEQLHKALTAKPLRDAFATFGLEPHGSTPQEAVALAKSDFARYGKLVKDLGIQPE